MFRNYLLVAVRHLARHKLFSAINVICLAIGITFSLLIGVYVLGERSVNSTLRNADRQYILKSEWKEANAGLDITTLAPMPEALAKSYPNLVANYYRYNPVTNVVSANDRHYKEDIAIGDTTLVSMYGFRLLHGDHQRAFTNNQSAVITETLARKLYGTDDAIGKTISITTTTGTPQDYTVSAVLATLPRNSVTDMISPGGYSVFLPSEGNRYFQGPDPLQSWANAFVLGMLELRPGIGADQLAKPMADMIANRADASIKGKLKATLSPVKDYYLDMNNGAVRRMLGTLAMIAAFILLMAIINFVNIHIGTSSYRIKEIGLRKVFGSARSQLIWQHLTESMVLTLISAALSLLLYQLLLPVFSQVMNTAMIPFWQFGVMHFVFLAALVTGAGIIAGIYPAVVLSASQTILAIKGKTSSGGGGIVLRKALLVLQFTIAIAVFISAVNISRQIRYCFSQNQGYDKEQVLFISAFPKQWDSAGVLKMETIRDAFRRMPVVKDATLSFEIPDRKPPNGYALVADGTGNQQPVNIPSSSADERYAATFGMTMKEGSFFAKQGEAGFQPGQVVLNEAAVKALGLTAPATGKKLRMPSAGVTLTVQGVVKDFHYASFQEQVGPVCFVPVRDINTYRFLSVKLRAGDVHQAVQAIKQTWQAYSPSAPFDYGFMDERFESLYRSELQLQQAARIATVLILVIVLMGITGVVAFTLNKRNKEIAVRKVLGADAGRIIVLFLKEYALLILLANFIAWPVAYAVSGSWLENYPYRIQQSWTTFLLVAIAGFAVALLLITAQCYRTAQANPVKSLRTE